MADREAKPLTQREVGNKFASMSDVARKMNNLDLAEGVDKDWQEFVQSGDSKFVAAARRLTRQFMVQGYLMAMEDALGVETPEGRKNFRGLLEEISFRNSSLYAQTCSPEAMCMESTYVVGIGRMPVWH